MGEPCNDLFSVLLLLLGIFPLGRNTFTGTESTNINANAHITAPRKISVLWIIAGRRAIVFAIGEIFEKGRELFARRSAVWHIESRGQPDPVVHRNPRVLHVDSIGR